MNRIAGRTAIVMVLVIALVAGMVFFTGEYLVQGGDWVTFPGSPHVYNGGNIGYGTVVDRSGEMLLDLTGGRTYSESEEVRKATIHWLGDRNGYISAPAIATYADAMTGFDPINGIYDYGGAVGQAELTLSSYVQTVAMEAMEGKHGTIGVYNYKTGEILCALSAPNYDPDNVPDIEADTTGAYDGAYLNRFVQSSFIPGSIFKSVTLAAALESLDDLDSWSYTCTGSHEINGEMVTCESAHGEVDIRSAFSRSCNCAFAKLSQDLGPERLEKYVDQFGITDSVAFDGITTAEGNFDVADAAELEVAWSAIGQHKDLVNPCRFMVYMGSIAGGGTGAEPYLVSRVRVGSHTTYRAKTRMTDRIMSKSTAETMEDFMRNNVETKYGAENFPGLTVCAKSGTGEVGGERRPNAMFAGFVADEAYPLAFVVAVEDGGYGSAVCVPILSRVLQACKEVMDS